MSSTKKKSSSKSNKRAAQNIKAVKQTVRAESFQVDLSTLPTFNLRDPTQWKQYLKSSSKDPYSFCVVRFAARWANAMERELATGRCLEEIVDSTGREADDEGITGFMYGGAVSILAAVWAHGDQLRRWHNIRYQIKDEGERANETGKTLNPALLTINS